MKSRKWGTILVVSFSGCMLLGIGLSCSAIHTYYGYEIRGTIEVGEPQGMSDIQSLQSRLLVGGEPIDFDTGTLAVIDESGNFETSLYNGEGAVGLAPVIPPPRIPIPDQIEFTIVRAACTTTIIVEISEETVTSLDLEVMPPGGFDFVDITLKNPIVVSPCE